MGVCRESENRPVCCLWETMDGSGDKKKYIIAKQLQEYVKYQLYPVHTVA
jgi:hypothetical protein